MTCQDSASHKRAIDGRPTGAIALPAKTYAPISFAALDPPWHFGNSCNLHAWGTKIDIDALVRIADLFRHRMDPAVLAVLAERPYRYRALTNRLTAQVRVHVDDNAVSRSLQRLTRFGLVQADSKYHGTRSINIYTLTDNGREMYLTYEAIATGYAHAQDARCDCRRCADDSGPCAEQAA